MSFNASAVVESCQPVSIVAAAAAVWTYRRAARSAGRWPARRAICLGLGVTVVLAVTCGPASYYGKHVYWVWLSQMLSLLLVAPVLLLAGQPIELARRTSPNTTLVRLVDSRVGRALTSPVVGPALIPVMCVLVLFGPTPGWSVEFTPVGWLVQATMLAVGCLIVLPLVGSADTATSLAVGAAVAIGFVELLIDAVPGLVLRLSTHPASSYFAHRRHLAGQPGTLRDQQIGGAVLWCAAELLDLPFLVLIFMRWIRADAREAAAVDAELDYATSAAARQGNGQTTDAPWFLTDPRLKDRLR